VMEWSVQAAVGALFAPHGVGLAFTPAEVLFTAASPEANLQEQADHHSWWLDTRAVIGEHAFVGLLQRHLAIFRAGNEDPAAFRSRAATSSRR
jgi:hypothetical protein